MFKQFQTVSNSFRQRTTIRFRRFCHKAYAAFCSLHREVTIGRVAAYMTDMEMLKQGKSIAVSALLLFAGTAVADADEGVPKDSVPLTTQQLSLQEVLVVSHKAEVNSEAYRLIRRSRTPVWRRCRYRLWRIFCNICRVSMYVLAEPTVPKLTSVCVEARSTKCW